MQSARLTEAGDPDCRMSAFSGGRSFGAAFPRRRFQLCLVGLCWMLAQPAAAQEIGRLYAARPPAGYSFVRVALADNPAGAGKVQMAADEARIDETSVATRYRAVKAGQPVSISVAGTPVAVTVIPRADQFSTVVVERDGPGWKGQAIDEGTGDSSDLKARLRFFNIARGCEALLKIAGGAVIFDATPLWSVRSRAINPVQARLEADCGGQIVPFVLPQLRAGDHFSIFLRGKRGESLSLSGQFDETEPYRDR